MKKAIILSLTCIAMLFTVAISISAIRQNQIDKLFEKYRNIGLEHAEIKIIYYTQNNDINAAEAYILKTYKK